MPRPRAAVRLIEAQAPLWEPGLIVERYTTARNVVFEKHTTETGVVHWFRVVKVGA